MPEKSYQTTDRISGGFAVPASSDQTSLIIGDVVRLLLASPEHGKADLRLVEQRLLPAIRLNQFRILRKGEKPLAYLSWAKLSPGVEKRLRQGGAFLEPKEWDSGDNLWVIDRITPSGAAGDALTRLEHALFQNSRPRSLLEETPTTRVSPRTGEQDDAKPGSVQIRLAENEDDLNILAGMVTAFHDEAKLRTESAVLLQGWRKQWREKANRHGVLIAELRGVPVGVLVAQVGAHAFTAKTAAQCLGFYVNPEHRGGFAAVKLLQGFKKWAAERNIETLTLHVTSGIDTARTDRLLRRMGFRQMGGNYEMALQGGME